MRARPPLQVRREGDHLVIHAGPSHEGAAVFAGPAPDRVDRARAVAHLAPRLAGEARLPLAGLPEADRHFLVVVGADGHEELVAERLLPLEGAQNFRDLGGWPAHAGRRVRWGRVFRSDSLSELTAADLARLERLGLRLVCDFRGDAEVEQEPNRLAGRAPFAYWRQPLGDRSVQPAEWRRRFESGDFGEIDASWLTRSYRGMIDDCAREIGAVFRRLAGEQGLPAVLHCTAGKDRTGVAAALLLLLLGVPREHVIEDYALTGLYTGDRIRSAERFFRERGIEPSRVRALLGSEPSTLSAALDHLDEVHGGAERWARERAGLAEDELVALREALLEP
jgi:protein-tyrosine phosphatase